MIKQYVKGLILFCCNRKKYLQLVTLGRVHMISIPHLAFSLCLGRESFFDIAEAKHEHEASR